MKPLEQLLPVTGPWRDPALLAVALTHRSYAHEANHPTTDNERLEFLGDAVIGFTVAEELYRRLPDDPVGNLARLRARIVSEVSLATAARDCGLGEYLRLGRGLSEHAGAQLDSLLADAFEAVVGALCLDGGLDRAREFVGARLAPAIDRALAGGLTADAKSLLNNYAQQEHGMLPHYRYAEPGAPADGIYRVTVLLGGTVLGEGEGRSKRAAEQAAARAACRACNLLRP